MALRIHSIPSSAWPSQSEDLALLHDDQVVVWVEGQRALLVEDSLVEVVPDDAYGGENTVHIAVVLVQIRVQLRVPAQS